MVDVFSKGSCINLFMILRSIYPESIAYYNIDHIITKIDDKFYDINGVVFKTENYKEFSANFNTKRKCNKAFMEMYNYQFNLKK